MDCIFNLKRKKKSSYSGEFGTHERNQKENGSLTINYIIRDNNLAYGGKEFNKAKSY